MRHLELRHKIGSDIQTIGVLSVVDYTGVLFTCMTLELPWKDNKRGVSRIITDDYLIEKFNSPMNGNCFLLKDVPGRSMIEIHVLNTYKETSGCIGVGREYGPDVDMDGVGDITDSKKTLSTILALMPEKSYIRIIDDFENF